MVKVALSGSFTRWFLPPFTDRKNMQHKDGEMNELSNKGKVKKYLQSLTRCKYIAYPFSTAEERFVLTRGDNA